MVLPEVSLNNITKFADGHNKQFLIFGTHLGNKSHWGILKFKPRLIN